MNKKNVEKVLKGVTLAGAAAFASTDVVFAETMTMDIDGVEGDDLKIVSETKVDTISQENEAGTEVLETTTTTTTVEVDTMEGNTLTEKEENIPLTEEEIQDVPDADWKSVAEGKGTLNPESGYEVEEVSEAKTIEENEEAVGEKQTITLSKTETSTEKDKGSLDLSEVKKVLGLGEDVSVVEEEGKLYYIDENGTRVDITVSGSASVDTKETYQVEVEVATNYNKSTKDVNQNTSLEGFVKDNEKDVYHYYDEVIKKTITLIKETKIVGEGETAKEVSVYVGTDLSGNVRTTYTLEESMVSASEDLDAIVGAVKREMATELEGYELTADASSVDTLVFTNDQGETKKITVSNPETITYDITAVRQSVKTGGNKQNYQEKYLDREGYEATDKEAKIYILKADASPSDKPGDYTQNNWITTTVTLDGNSDYIRGLTNQILEKRSEVRFLNNGGELQSEYTDVIENPQDGIDALQAWYNGESKDAQNWRESYKYELGIDENWKISFVPIEINGFMRGSSVEYHVDYGVVATKDMEPVVQTRVTIGTVTTDLKDTYEVSVSGVKTVEKQRNVDETITTVKVEEETVPAGNVTPEPEPTTPEPEPTTPEPEPTTPEPEPTTPEPEPITPEPVEIQDEDVPLEDLPEVKEELPEVEEPQAPTEETPIEEIPEEDLNTIEDEEVPLAVQEVEENVTIPEEDVPLSDNPETGDVLPVGWIASAATAVSGLVASLKGKKKDDSQK